MCERRLEHRPEQRVVACYDRAKTLLAADRFCNTPDESYIDKRVHRIGWLLDEDHRDLALGHDAFRPRMRLSSRPSMKPSASMPKRIRVFSISISVPP